MKTIIAHLFLATIAAQSFQSNAASSIQNIVDLQQNASIYTPSKVIKSSEVSYPTSARRDKTEGYFEVTYDLSEQGVPMNIRYSRISGLEIFETLIERNFNNWVFAPATFNGEAVAQKNLQHVFTFTLTKLSNKYPEPLMRRSFASVYLKMRELLKEDDLEKLGELLALMEQATVVRLAENRQLALLKYSYLNKVDGSIQDKILSLEQALKDKPRTEKTKKLNSKIKANLFKLYVANKQYYQAFIQFNNLSKSEYSSHLLDDLAPLLQEVMTQLSSGDPLSTSVKIDETELFTHYLSRHSFTLNTNADIKFAELQCDKFNVKVDYAPNTIFEIPIDWEGCGLVLQAEKGSLVSISEANNYL